MDFTKTDDSTTTNDSGSDVVLNVNAQDANQAQILQNTPGILDNTNSSQPMSDQGSLPTDNTTITTNEGSTLQTFNDPFASPPVAADSSQDAESPNGVIEDNSQLNQTDITTDLPTFSTPSDTSTSSSELDDIKKQALEQLRPLMEKVDLPATEKFDKYLMMLRATDDTSLIQPAFNTAQLITDDNDKAEALVDIINEINYVSNGTTGPEHTFKS